MTSSGVTQRILKCRLASRNPVAARGWSGLFGALLMIVLIVPASPSFAQDTGEETTGTETEAETETAAARRRNSREERDRTAAWMPSFALSWGFFSQSIDGRTRSTETPIAPDSGDSYLSTGFQFEGKLHTPLQLDIPGKPRIFLAAGFQLPLAKELIAQKIDTSFDQRIGQVDLDFQANCPTNLPGPLPGGITNPNNLATTCSLEIRNRVTIDAAWYVGVGVDITIPILDGQFHISPAFEYYGLAAHTVGDFERSSSGPQIDTFIEQANVVGNSEIYHGVSPSLALSVDVYEDGPWRWSIFLQSRVVFLLTDPLTKASGEFGTNQLTFVSELDDFLVQGTGGIQLQWTGR
jgi:hypothetical protein